jgi:hypothetical protein
MWPASRNGVCVDIGRFIRNQEQRSMADLPAGALANERHRERAIGAPAAGVAAHRRIHKARRDHIAARRRAMGVRGTSAILPESCYRLRCHPVIASEAKQSISPQKKEWIASSLSLLAMTAETTAPPENRACRSRRRCGAKCRGRWRRGNRNSETQSRWQIAGPSASWNCSGRPGR